ncbi:hypothetical protein [Psychrobacillus sp.]|uniref:hypothetical protein n=1 Tax=Psychrobacillus sp. TaxID=1871623 RepID=UPI0028BDA053|nr:hypothetical protein [Psychrobacillus sp.]
MLSKFIKVALISVLVFTFSTVYTVGADASTKVMWGKTELKLGQVGKITVLSKSSLFKLESDGTLTTVRTLKKGEEFRVYSYKSNQGGLYGVGGGSFIQKNSNIKYETPSKSKLALLKNQGTTLSISEETFNMSVSQVEKSESAKLLNKIVEGNITELTYETNKFGYEVHLKYIFLFGQLITIEYDFLPEEESYYTWNEMIGIHDNLHKKAVSELGKDYLIYTDDGESIFTVWKREPYTMIVSVVNQDTYTSATLVYNKEHYLDSIW